MSEIEKLLEISHKATGIGSVPHTDTEGICRTLLEKCRDLPYWPQMEKVDFRVGMMVQYTENFPCLKIDNDKSDVYYDKSVNRDDAIL